MSLGEWRVVYWIIQALSALAGWYVAGSRGVFVVCGTFLVGTFWYEFKPKTIR